MVNVFEKLNNKREKFRRNGDYNKYENRDNEKQLYLIISKLNGRVKTVRNKRKYLDGGVERQK